MKKLWEYLNSVKLQFFKYFVVGISTVTLDMLTLILLKEKMHFTAVWAVVINQIVVISFNFSLNKAWSFKEVAFSHKQLFRFLSLVFFNYLFSIAAMYVFSDKLGFDYRLVRITSIALMVIWNFLLYKYWVYIEDPKIQKIN